MTSFQETFRETPYVAHYATLPTYNNSGFSKFNAISPVTSAPVIGSDYQIVPAFGGIASYDALQRCTRYGGSYCPFRQAYKGKCDTDYMILPLVSNYDRRRRHRSRREFKHHNF